MFTYKEGDEASYFVISEDSGGEAANVGPLGAGTSKGSPMSRTSLLHLPKTFLWSLMGLMLSSKKFGERLLLRQLRRYRLLVIL